MLGRAGGATDSFWSLDTEAWFRSPGWEHSTRLGCLAQEGRPMILTGQG